MGLFGDDTSFRQQTNWGDTGGSAPAGWYTYGNAKPTASGQTPLQFYNPNNGQVVNTGQLNSLLGPGADSAGNVTGWEKPGTFSNQNLDLIIGNQGSLAAGNNLPFAQQAFQRSYLNDPNTVMSDPSMYMFNGDPNFAANRAQGLNMQAAAAQGRVGPQINGAATNMMFTGAGNSLQQANGTNFLGVGNANALAGVANGAGYQGQLSSAQGLQNLAGHLDDGPSPAEMAMRQSNDAGLANQAALAASARGGNSALAMRNAASNAAGLNAQTTQNVGIQRAQEQYAVNQQKMQALGMANQGFGGAAGTQQGAYGAAGGLLGNIAGNQVGQANTGVQMGGIYANMANAQGQLGLGTMNANDQYSTSMQELANRYLSQQLQASGNYNQNRTQNTANILTNQYANRDKSGEGTITGSGGGDKALGIGASTLGTGLAALSDIRAKKDIAHAGEDVSNAIRNVNVQYPTVGGVPTTSFASTDGFNAPAYSYKYKDPNAIGAAGGVHYGPMAQDLEKTPAGASVVVDKGGRKAIDTGRLSLLNTAELSKMRQELDAINGQAAQVRGTQVQYPNVGGVPTAAFGPPAQSPARPPVPDLSEAMAQAGRVRGTQVQYPTLGGV